MKAKFDKKLIFLFLIMVLMVVLMFYFLKKNTSSGIDEEILTNAQDYGKIMEVKRNKINDLLTEVENIFDQDFQNFIDNLDSYLVLPIKINANELGNKYPFSNPIDEEESENLEQ